MYVSVTSLKPEGFLLFFCMFANESRCGAEVCCGSCYGECLLWVVRCLSPLAPPPQKGEFQQAHRLGYFLLLLSLLWLRAAGEGCVQWRCVWKSSIPNKPSFCFKKYTKFCLLRSSLLPAQLFSSAKSATKIDTVNATIIIREILPVSASIYLSMRTYTR